jgi:hypothetical protein
MVILRGKSCISLDPSVKACLFGRGDVRHALLVRRNVILVQLHTDFTEILFRRVDIEGNDKGSVSVHA